MFVFIFIIIGILKGGVMKNISKKLGTYVVFAMIMAVVGVCIPAQNASAVQATAADIISVVDESGSMSTEHTWLGGMSIALEAGLQAAGVTSNQYGLVGYGGHAAGGANNGHKHAVGGADYGTAAQYSTAAGGLATSGGTEDGYAGIDFALNNYAQTSERGNQCHISYRRGQG